MSIVMDWHVAGIHLGCKPIPPGSTWPNTGDGTHRRCRYAGKVERWHTHEFDGLLPCGCDDWGTE